MRIWSSPDARFVLPKSYFYFKFRLPEMIKIFRGVNSFNAADFKIVLV